MSEERKPQVHASTVSVERAQLVVFGLVTVIGALVFAPLVATRSGDVTISLAVPAGIGAFCGLFVKDGRSLLLVGGVIAAILAMLFAVMIGDVFGLFCGAVFGVVALPPAMVAGLIVLAIRRHAAAEDAKANDRPAARSLLLLLAMPYAVAAIEDLFDYQPVVESLVVSRDFAAPIARVWGQSLDFSDSPPSAWAVVDGPLPQRASGNSSRVGDEKRIQFAKGEILVRVVEVVPGRRLVAQVLEQTIEVCAVRLRRVVITCDPIRASATHVSLRIEFDALLRPRWYWRLYEPLFGGVAMDAVLDAWQATAEKPYVVVGG